MKKIKHLIKNIIYSILPKKTAHKLLYYRIMKKKLNLKDPKDLNEKIQWLIVNEYGKDYAKYADKVLVRDYIKDKGYEHILTKVYGIYKNVNDIPFDTLPDKFVLKANNISGKVHICTDKNNFDIDKCKKELKKELKSDFSKRCLEYHYSYIKPQIICEEYIEDGSGAVMPLDYKFFCFDGKAECVLLCSEREKGHKVDCYDLKWNYLDYITDEYKSEKLYDKPQNLDEMIKIAEDLSKDFRFVRVDLYNVNGKIYFGELTLTPSAGFSRTFTQEALNYLGSKLKLPIEGGKN